MQETFRMLASRGYCLRNYGKSLRYFTKGLITGRHIVVVVNSRGKIKDIVRNY